ncbi:MAG: hypothetical protein NTW28_32090 [Candidatus Solibacter sp.]|nr:hypothetical protein [Candidatus Solibacter sp.]
MFLHHTASRAGVLACAALMALGAIPAWADHLDYAVLFSGGFNQDSNHDYYYNATLNMWDLTVNTLGFDASRVYVLSADGTDPAADLKSGGNSDWSAAVARGSTVEAASSANLASLFDHLADTMTVDDSFYFWSFDHGGNSDPAQVQNSVLWGWNQEAIQAADFAAWAADFQVKAQIYAFAQCYASGMAYALTQYPRTNRFAAWASAWDESSWSDGWASAWAEGIQSGIRDTVPLGIYARDHDIFAAAGWEHPGFIGNNINIVTNEAVVPEPHSVVLLATFVGLLVVVRKRRSAQPMRVDRVSSIG